MATHTSGSIATKIPATAPPTAAVPSAAATSPTLSRTTSDEQRFSDTDTALGIRASQTPLHPSTSVPPTFDLAPSSMRLNPPWDRVASLTSLRLPRDQPFYSSTATKWKQSV
ncbi:MAG: hypothetical protein J3Q66DRAFT_398745 [Benniella sp.]|nr:MAG: hypothetical protein J3Q66DRAFT_398745 [Benniella sp.]